MPSRVAVRAIRTAISPRLAIRTEENMGMRYHPGDGEYTSPEVFHRPLLSRAGSAGEALSYAAAVRPRLLPRRGGGEGCGAGIARADPYCAGIVVDGRGTAPSAGASPAAIGAAGCGLDGRVPAAVGEARTGGRRRGGTGVARELASPGATVGCVPDAEPALG